MRSRHDAVIEGVGDLDPGAVGDDAIAKCGVPVDLDPVPEDGPLEDRARTDYAALADHDSVTKPGAGANAAAGAPVYGTSYPPPPSACGPGYYWANGGCYPAR